MSEIRDLLPEKSKLCKHQEAKVHLVPLELSYEHTERPRQRKVSTAPMQVYGDAPLMLGNGKGTDFQAAKAVAPCTQCIPMDPIVF